MNKDEIEKMEPDATAVDKGRKSFENFSDLLGDNKSLTMIKVEKLKAPDDIDEDTEEDIQDNTSVDLSDLMHKLMKGGHHGMWN